MDKETVNGDLKDSEQTVEDVSDVVDPAAEKRLVRKVDIRLIPILFVLYLCAFIDRYVSDPHEERAQSEIFRVNIGNARIQGLEADLDMTGEDYNSGFHHILSTPGRGIILPGSYHH